MKHNISFTDLLRAGEIGKVNRSEEKYRIQEVEEKKDDKANKMNMRELQFS